MASSVLYGWDMLRITETFENDSTIRLRLDGTLSDISCVEVQQACTRCYSNSRQIILLDMAGVVFMNNHAATKIVELKNDRLRIINCSPFIETLLHAVEDEKP